MLSLGFFLVLKPSCIRTHSNLLPEFSVQNVSGHVTEPIELYRGTTASLAADLCRCGLYLISGRHTGIGEHDLLNKN